MKAVIARFLPLAAFSDCLFCSFRAQRPVLLAALLYQAALRFQVNGSSQSRILQLLVG